MKILTLINSVVRFGLGLLVSASMATYAQTTCSAEDCSTGFDVFLLIGQSNMAGRGKIPDPIDDDGKPDPAIWMWDGTKYLSPDMANLPADSAARIVVAKDPIIHTEHRQSLKTGPDGTTEIQNLYPRAAGLGMSFAKAYLKWLRANGHPNRRVLLVGAAWGGTGFTMDDRIYGYRWRAIDDETLGGDLYREAVARANNAISAAMTSDGGETTAFKGILWHQGEHDIAHKGGNAYAEHHTALMNALRKNIKGAAAAPIVVGEMTPCFLERCKAKWDSLSITDRDQVLNYLHNIKNHLTRSAWVSSAGLKGNPLKGGVEDDSIHFDTDSLREMGRRYFAKYWEATLNLPMPMVDLKSYDNIPFNVGNSIDLDTTFTSPRITGNLKINGNITVVADARLGNVVQVPSDAKSLSALVNGTLFNASYTKMAWVKLASYDSRNNILSASNPSQAHYVYTPARDGVFAAGHSSLQDRIKVDIKAASPLALDKWAHLAITYDAPSSTMSLYVNGAFVKSTTGIAPATQASGLVTLDIPGWADRPGFALHGDIVSAKVYDSALTYSQIKNIFNFEWRWQKGFGRQ